MDNRNSTGDTPAKNALENGDGIDKADEVRAILSGVIAMLDAQVDEVSAEACILLTKARDETQVMRQLFEGVDDRGRSAERR